MSRFLSDRLSALSAYTPGEQPQDRRYIKLNTNESPFPPSKSVIEAVTDRALSNLRLYCDPTCRVLRERLAACYGVGMEHVFVSNGSDEILNFAFMAYGSGGAVFPDITYGFYGVFAALYGIDTEIIPLKEDFTVDTASFAGQNKLLVLANPNAPTGIALGLRQIEELVRRNPGGVVLIDEAYVDFGAESCVGLTKKYDNLLVVQTYSKSRSMAGARLGFAIGSETLIADLEKVKYATNPYNVNSLTQAAGAAALTDRGYYAANCAKITETRGRVTAALRKMGFTVLPSEANFVFAKSDRVGGRDLYLALKQRGILVRHFEKPRIADYNRITVGAADEMQAFIDAVREILNENA